MHDWRNPERVVPWKPRQRFDVTALGREAAALYREAVERAQRSSEARRELPRAKQLWAERYRLRPGDGILLEDIAAGQASLGEMKATLEACDLSLRDARGTIDRLIAAGLIEALELPRS